MVVSCFCFGLLLVLATTLLDHPGTGCGCGGEVTIIYNTIVSYFYYRVILLVLLIVYTIDSR